MPLCEILHSLYFFVTINSRYRNSPMLSIIIATSSITACFCSYQPLYFLILNIFLILKTDEIIYLIEGKTEESS